MRQTSHWLLPAFGLSLAVCLSSCGFAPTAQPPADSPAVVQLRSGLEFIHTHQSKPTFHDWEACAPALNFLLHQNDPAAQAFAIRVLPRLAEVDQVLDREIRNLAWDAYSDWQSLQTVLRTMPLDDQLFVVLLLDDLKPVDWFPGLGDQTSLLQANPTLQQAYYEHRGRDPHQAVPEPGAP